MSTETATRKSELHIKDEVEYSITEFFINRYFLSQGSNPEGKKLLHTSIEHVVRNFYSTTVQKAGINSNKFNTYTEAAVNDTVDKIKKALDECISLGYNLKETLDRIGQVYNKEIAAFTHAVEDAKQEVENLDMLQKLNLWGYIRYKFKAAGKGSCKKCTDLSDQVFLIYPRAKTSFKILPSFRSRATIVGAKSEVLFAP